MSGSSPQAVVERALGLSRSSSCMVLVRERSTANLRWAGSSLTTNGVAQGRTVTVIALTDGPSGTAVGVVARSGLRDDELEELVRAAEAASESALPSEEAAPLLGPAEAGAGGDWDAPAATTGVDVFSAAAAGLGRAFRASADSGRLHYGYAEHTVESVFLGTSTGVRLRHDQPTGTIEMNTRGARRRAPTRVRRGSAGPPGTSPTSTRTRSTRSWPGAPSGRAPRWSCRPGGTRRSCRPPRWPT
ncbi:hypothetical protein ACFQXA_11615 [Nocardiopsis composta]